MTREPEVLIISNLFDFSTDFITARLRELNIDFLRLNRDDLKDHRIELNPFTPSLFVSVDGCEFKLHPQKLKSIYYRAPTFLREGLTESLSEEEQLYKTQWAAFVRSLIVFDCVKWVNNPVATYKAEMKPYQLYIAKKIGFNIPNTIIANTTFSLNVAADKIAIKSIDTAIVSKGDNEAFVYTTLMSKKEIEPAHYTSPFFLQEGLTPKTDIRITVIDDTIVPVKIVSEGGISGDWRKHTGTIHYELFELPEETKNHCHQLAKSLELSFCAIDMVQFQNKYYFIEVNPTGEWSWLQKNTGYEFDKKITEALV